MNLILDFLQVLLCSFLGDDVEVVCVRESFWDMRGNGRVSEMGRVMAMGIGGFYWLELFLLHFAPLNFTLN